MSSPPEEIEISDDGHTVPVMDVMTGRGLITGKSGSGKSNTGSVIAEELLDHGLTVFIIDTDGEYFGLKQEYELLHVGGDDTCDVEVGVEHGKELARLAIEENVPIILDVSAYLDPTQAEQLIETTLRHLFVMEKTARKPLLVFVEEIHEYIPERGGLDDLGETLVQVAKRGRKRGLGLCGMSQRPAAVDKDFITQCNWIAWHRLTWENDTQVVGRIMESSYAESVQELDDGEAFLMTDWDEQVRRIMFRRKKTFDAGATPGLEEFDPPDMRSVRSDLIDDLAAVGTSDDDTTDSDAEASDESEETDESSSADADEADDPASEPASPTLTSTTSEPAETETRQTEPSREDSVALEFAYLVAHAFDWLITVLARGGRVAGEYLARAGQQAMNRVMVSAARVRGDGGTHRRDRVGRDPLTDDDRQSKSSESTRTAIIVLALLVGLGIVVLLLVS